MNQGLQPPGKEVLGRREEKDRGTEERLECLIVTGGYSCYISVSSPGLPLNLRCGRVSIQDKRL